MKVSSYGMERDGLILPLELCGQQDVAHVENGSAEPCPARK